MPAVAATRNTETDFLLLAAAQTFKAGAFVLLDGSLDVAECGADPALIYAIALEDAGKNQQDPLFVTVMKLREDQQFWMDGSSAFAQTDVGASYGVAKDADGIWYVDKTDVVNTRVFVHRIDVNTNRALVSVKEANRQIPA